MTVQNFITLDVSKDATPKEWLHCGLGDSRKVSATQSTWQGTGGLKM